MAVSGEASSCLEAFGQSASAFKKINMDTLNPRVEVGHVKGNKTLDLICSQVETSNRVFSTAGEKQSKILRWAIQVSFLFIAINWFDIG